ncbi:MAG: MFS transporter [Bradymonadaceae bacterium]|nr:MFS transporter [Lujinxingiaceae bacterium]
MIPASAVNTTIDRQASFTLMLLCAVVFLSVVNGTMVNVALPIIGQAFQVTEGTYGWIVTGNALAFGIFNAVHGRLADIVGIRRLYLLGIVIFGATSVLVALSPTIEIAIALRVFQGAGSAAIPALGAMIVVRSFPPSKRGAAMGLILGSVGVAASLGPFLGGLLVQISGWRAVFLFTSVVLLAVPVGLKLLPKSLDERIPQKFDVLGALLLGIGVTALLYSFNVIERLGFGATFAALIAIGVLGLAAFGWRISHTPEPFAHPDLFRNTGFVTITAVAFLSNATRFGTIVLVPIFLIEVNGLAPVWVGLVLLPGALMIAAISPLSGKLSDRIGARRPVAAGMLLLVAGNLVTACFAGGNVLGVTIGMALYGMGFALLQSPLVASVTRVLAPQRASGGMGIFMMIFFLGGAFGVALSVTAVELQSREAASWLGFSLGAGAPYSNAVLTLTGLALLGLLMLPGLPSTPGVEVENAADAVDGQS